MSTGKTAAAKTTAPAKGTEKEAESPELVEMREKLAKAEADKKEAEDRAKEAEKAQKEAEKEAEKARSEAEKARSEAEKAKVKADESEEDTTEVEAVVNRKEKLYTVKFIETHTMYHDKKSRTFQKNDVAEVDLNVANKLFQRKIAVVISQ